MTSFHNSSAPSFRNFYVVCIATLSFVLALHSKPTNSVGLRSAEAGMRPASSGSSHLQEVNEKPSGCVSCHTSTDEPSMHPTKTVHLDCTDCHGGDSSTSIVPGTAQGSPEYNSVKEKAHVQPHN